MPWDQATSLTVIAVCAIVVAACSLFNTLRGFGKQ